MNDRFVHVYGGGIGRSVGSSSLADAPFDFRHALQDLILPTKNSKGFIYRNGRVGYRHVHDIALVQRRHELFANSSSQNDGAGE